MSCPYNPAPPDVNAAPFTISPERVRLERIVPVKGAPGYYSAEFTILPEPHHESTSAEDAPEAANDQAEGV